MINVKVIPLDIDSPIFIITIVVIALGFIAFWIKTLIEIGRSNFKDDTHRVLWLIFVVLMPLIGMIFYYALGRNRRIR